MKTKIEDLREHLFATLEALRDEEKPMDLARAKTISDVAQTVIASAKVEVDFINAVGARRAGSSFFPAAPEPDALSGNKNGAPPLALRS